MEVATRTKVTVRDMRPEDIEAGRELSREQKWPHRTSDWTFMLERGSGVVAERDGKLVGTTMCWPYGEDFATLGMVIVSPECQGEGIGGKLMAAALDRLGQRVGLIDADIYGHSIPHMLGISQRPIVVDKMIVPPVRGSLKFISIGNFLDENAPVMWRGPMLHRALEQFLSDVHWGELDTMVVDMPPGTGDMAISLAQLLPRAEVLVVTTPQPAAQQVAVRAAQMAVKSGMRLLGVVENMSYLVGTGQELFGAGGGQALADEVDAPLLGSVPLDPALREAADAGVPVVESDPGSEAALAIAALAISALAEAVAAPKPGAIRKPLTLLG